MGQSMSELKIGDKVKVSYTGTVRRATSDLTQVVDDGGGWHAYRISAGVQLEKLSPAHWPPRVGDVWEADGRVYFIRDTSAFVLLALDAQSHHTLGVPELAKLSPELRYRKGTTGA